MTASLAPSSIGLPALEPRLEADLTRGLDAVEELLRTDVSSEFALVDEAARHFGDPGRREVVEAAVVVELTHLASLYHDDVMDEATLRRGAPSTNVRYGNAVSILVGDFLFARAAARVSGLGPDSVRIQAETFERLVLGQIRETQGPGVGDPLEHYLAVLADKTGSLIATSGRFGALHSGAGLEVADALTRYGDVIGVAFQLADDLLDVAGDSDASGKAVGTDLREGVATLPVLCFRRIANPSVPADARLLSLLDSPLDDDAAVREAVTLLRAHRALADARNELRSWAQRARDELVVLPAGPAREALDALAVAVVEREG